MRNRTEAAEHKYLFWDSKRTASHSQQQLPPPPRQLIISPIDWMDTRCAIYYAIHFPSYANTICGCILKSGAGGSIDRSTDRTVIDRTMYCSRVLVVVAGTHIPHCQRIVIIIIIALRLGGVLVVQQQQELIQSQWSRITKTPVTEVKCQFVHSFDPI